MKLKQAELGQIVDVNWGDTSITKKSYVNEGFIAFSASGPDGYLETYDFDSKGIVLSAIGAKCGKCFWADGKWKAIKNTITITPKKDVETNLRYLFYYLNNDRIWPKRGMGQPFIGLKDARKVTIPCPPISEQKRIATILDKADALRTKRKQAIAKLDVNRPGFSGDLVN